MCSSSEQVLGELIARIEPASAIDALRASERVRQAAPADIARILAPLAATLAGAAHSIAPAVDRTIVLVVAADRKGQQSCAAELIAVARGEAAVCAAARSAGSAVVAVDVGLFDDGGAPGLPGADPGDAVLSFRIGDGSNDTSLGPAMTAEEARAALQTGFALVYSLADAGLDVLGLGAIDSAAVQSAVAVIDRVVGGGEPVAALVELGGFDIGVLAGAIAGAASIRVPAVIDGITTAAAALIASALCEPVRGYVVAAHSGQLTAHRLALSALELSPLFPQGVSRGDGAGAALALPLIASAAQVLREIG